VLLPILCKTQKIDTAFEHFETTRWRIEVMVTSLVVYAKWKNEKSRL
jgi:hypothetical protein